jgi:pyrroloquinoline-quinone synthase
MKKFSTVAEQGEAIEAFASFYAYESQVPRVAEAKESGLKERYGADAKSCYYFTVHKTADIHHSNVWVDLIEGELQRRPELRSAALDACETAAASLWHTLDGIEEHRQSKRRLNSCSVGS